MAGWSPELVVDAYLHTLQLCKEHEEQANDVMEPRSMEYIAALAAGNHARLLLHIAAGDGDGDASTAVAFAIAAARTGGPLAIVRDDPRSLDAVRGHLRRLGLESSSAEFHLLIGRPLESVLRRLRRVDFAVVDAKLDRCGEVMRAIDVDPNGAIVVVTNVFVEQQEDQTTTSSGHGGESRVRVRCSYGQVVGKKGKSKSMVLPIGRHGMEVTKIGGAHMQRHKKLVSTPKRTFLVCE
uniref:Uncharacterized protein n=1 Tax=Leersia perrieri TaxID=77586 RepID=A0A0D9X3Q1_9ORYZ